MVSEHYQRVYRVLIFIEHTLLAYGRINNVTSIPRCPGVPVSYRGVYHENPPQSEEDINERFVAYYHQHIFPVMSIGHVAAFLRFGLQSGFEAHHVLSLIERILAIGYDLRWISHVPNSVINALFGGSTVIEALSQKAESLEARRAISHAHACRLWLRIVIKRQTAGSQLAQANVRALCNLIDSYF